MILSFTSGFQCCLQVELEVGRLVVSADPQPAPCSPETSYWPSLRQSSAARWTESREIIGMYVSK